MPPGFQHVQDFRECWGCYTVCGEKYDNVLSHFDVHHSVSWTNKHTKMFAISCRWGGKHLHYFAANYSGIYIYMYIKFYQNWPTFYRRYDKNILVFFSVQSSNCRWPTKYKCCFTKWCRDIIQVRWKIFKLLCGRFIQDNMGQILWELARFRRRYDKEHFGVVFRFTTYCMSASERPNSFSTYWAQHSNVRYK